MYSGMYIPDVVCPKCGKKQQYNLNGTDFWGHKVAKCCGCKHEWEVKMEEFKSSKRCNLEDFTTEELLKELVRRLDDSTIEEILKELLKELERRKR